VALPPASVSGTNQVAGFKPQIQQYLTPLRKAIASPQAIASLQKEAGQPLVNSIGQLSGMAPTNGPVVSSQDIGKLLQSVEVLKTPPTNLVHDDWNTGISSYFTGVANSDKAKQSDLAQAQNAFEDAFQKNGQFEGAQTFAQAAKSAAAPPVVNPKPTSTPAPDSSSLLESGKIYGIPIWLESVMMLILLVTIFGAVYVVYGRSRTGRIKVLEEYAQEGHQAHLKTPPIARADIAQSPSSRPPLTTPVLSSSMHPPTQVRTSPVDIQSVRCPACGVYVLKGVTSCPNCRQSLVPKPSTPSQPDQSFGRPGNPVVAVDPSRTSSFASSVHDASIMKEPVQERRPDLVTPDSVKIPVSEKPEEVFYSPSRGIGETSRVGQRLGNYRLVRGLGHGGFADVYLGEHVFLKTQAAIKVLHTRLTRETLISFLNEARTIAELVHPHIVRILEFGVEGDEPDLEQSVFDAEGCIPYLIMDYASGGTLRKRHPKGTRLPLPTILPYVRHVADALQYAHDKRLIHRDIKPENMLVGHNNEVLLSDFGIAAVAHSERSMSTQEMAGTVPYMAPEQIRGKPRPASDQYALAIVIYEWLCGSRPFQGSQWEIIDQQLSASPLPMYKRGAPVSPVVESVVMKALAKDPLQRFDSVQAFALAFEQASLSR
jgi:tRNA A-37 threonylcarbamoyl transferase component Bud32